MPHHFALHSVPWCRTIIKRPERYTAAPRMRRMLSMLPSLRSREGFNLCPRDVVASRADASVRFDAVNRGVTDLDVTTGWHVGTPFRTRTPRPLECPMRVVHWHFGTLRRLQYGGVTRLHAQHGGTVFHLLGFDWKPHICTLTPFGQFLGRVQAREAQRLGHLGFPFHPCALALRDCSRSVSLGFGFGAMRFDVGNVGGNVNAIFEAERGGISLGHTC